MNNSFLKLALASCALALPMSLVAGPIITGVTVVSNPDLPNNAGHQYFGSSTFDASSVTLQLNSIGFGWTGPGTGTGEVCDANYCSDSFTLDIASTGGDLLGGQTLYACAIAFNNSPLSQCGPPLNYNNFTRSDSSGATQTDGNFWIGNAQGHPDFTLALTSDGAGGTLVTATQYTPYQSSFGLVDVEVSIQEVAPTAPEPGSVVLFGTGLVGLVGFVRRRKV